jgi:hypothetical protein
MTRVFIQFLITNIIKGMSKKDSLNPSFKFCLDLSFSGYTPCSSSFLPPRQNMGRKAGDAMSDAEKQKRSQSAIKKVATDNKKLNP